MKLILKFSAVASCSLIAVMQIDVTQQETTTTLTSAKLIANTLPTAAAALSVVAAPYLRSDYSDGSVLATAADTVFIGEQSFDIGEIQLDVLVTFEYDTFNFKYTATNKTSYPVYWAGSNKNCGVKNYSATFHDEAYPPNEQSDVSAQYGKIELEQAQQMLMVAGEQRIIKMSIPQNYFGDIERSQISSLRWWSVVPLPNTKAADIQHEFGDLYGSWNDRGKFELEFQAPFWNNNSNVPKFKTALANKLKLGKHREVIGGLQIDSELHYESGDVLEKITVTNISGGSLYWPRSVSSSGRDRPIGFIVDKQRIRSWSSDTNLGLGGGRGGHGCYHGRREKPSAADLARWLIEDGEVFEYQSRNKFDSKNFRSIIYFKGRDAIRGVGRVYGATHTMHEALDYPPEFFPRSSKWGKKSFKASFDKDKGYSHILCE